MWRHAVRIVDDAFELLAVILVVALLGSVTLGIITRAAGDPLIWTDELSRFLMVWLAMFGWIISSRRRGHVRIRFFQGLLPPPWWRIAELLIQAGMLVLGLIVGWFGVGLVFRNADLEAMSMPVSMAWMYAPLVPAGVVTALQAISEMTGQLRRPRGSPLGESAIE